MSLNRLSNQSELSTISWPECLIFLYLEQTVRTVAGEKLLKDGEQDDAGDADTGHDDHAVRGGLGILLRCKKSSALEHY